MDMSGIAKKAQEEGMGHKGNILKFLEEQRLILINKRIQASDVNVPTGYLYAIEEIADVLHIPCYYICGNTFSIALTYSALLRHERER